MVFDECKIENFKMTYPDREFPYYRTLSDAEAVEKCRRLLVELGVEPFSDVASMRFARTVQERLVRLRDDTLCADQDGFQFARVLDALSLPISEKVLIDWLQYPIGYLGFMDEFSMRDLIQYWDDIWYPGTDDIFMIHENYAWVLYCCHDGFFYYKIFSEDRQ